MFDLATIWAGLLALAIFVYVILDGFDLGIGILFPFLDTKSDRDVAMNSVAPVWDGNETWLVLGGGGLMAAFPLAYAIVMPALYMPIIIMLLALVFRGVAFEFRWRDPAHEMIWDRSPRAMPDADWSADKPEYDWTGARPDELMAKPRPGEGTETESPDDAEQPL